MKHLLMSLAFCSISFCGVVTSCATLSEPVDGTAGVYTYTLPDGSSVQVSSPAPPAGPFTHTLPDGTEVVLTPAMQTAGPKTVGDVVANTVGGLVGTFTANPLVGFAVGGVLASLFGRKKPAQPTVAPEPPPELT